MPHLKCKLALTRYPINPRSNLKDAINDEVLSFYHLADGVNHFCHVAWLLPELL